MIEVEGLRELRSALRQIDAGRELGKANKIISKFVADRAEPKRQRLESQFPAYDKLENQIRPSAAQSAAQVLVRGPTAAAGEFGSKFHPVFGRSLPQVAFQRRVWPRHSGDGYLVRPVIKENTDRIVFMYGDAVDEMTKRAFPEDRGVD